MAETIYEYATKSWPVVLGCDESLPCAARCWGKRTAVRLAGSPNEQVREAHFGLVNTELLPYRDNGGRQASRTYWTGTVRLNEEHLTDPLRWRTPQRIAVAYHGDLFLASDQLLDQVFDVMQGCATSEHVNGEWRLKPLHTFLVLTKRPERMRDYLLRRMARAKEYADQFDKCPTPEMRDSPAARWARQVATGTYFSHIWLGVSVEDQAAADVRIPLLLQTPAAVRWVSLEPMVGPVDLTPWLACQRTLDECHARGLWPEYTRCSPCAVAGALDWVVLGGESGPGARPMHPDWARKVRYDCQAAGVRFYFKQWGEWAPRTLEMPNEGDRLRLTWRGRNGQDLANSGDGGDVWMQRVGKKLSGRELDGRTWEQMPEVKP